MAKRANPFCEDFVQQSKTHVGLKQFNNNDERLQKVYKKTLAILFKGAKKQQQDNNKSDMEVNTKKDGLKQLFIAADGSLLHSGEMVKRVATLKSACGGAECERREGGAVGACAYCEAALCARCERPCSRCALVHCARCSIFVSEGSQVCVSCYD